MNNKDNHEIYGLYNESSHTIDSDVLDIRGNKYREIGDNKWERLDAPGGPRDVTSDEYFDIMQVTRPDDYEEHHAKGAKMQQMAKHAAGELKKRRDMRGKAFNTPDQRKSDEREMELMRAMQKFGHGADYNTPFEETDHSKDDPAEVKEGTKGTKADREKADRNDDGKIEDWEKATANAIRHAQGKKHLCAKTVVHEQHGPGAAVHAHHALPDVDGKIEWYMVEFKHGIEKVYTRDLDIITEEEH